MESLAAIRAFVRERATRLGLPPEEIGGLLLAVDEAVTNVIQHGYREREGSVEVEIGRDAQNMVIRLRDGAPPFDPMVIPPPDLAAPLEDRPIGGLGVHLIRQNVDAVQYRVTAQGGNELTLVKSLKR